MPKVAREISELECDRITRIGAHCVGGVPGLLLSVTACANGSGVTRSWVLRISIDGRRRDIGLGRYTEISLVRARELASEFKLKRTEAWQEKESRRIIKAKEEDNLLRLLEEKANAKVREKILINEMQMIASGSDNQYVSLEAARFHFGGVPKRALPHTNGQCRVGDLRKWWKRVEARTPEPEPHQLYRHFDAHGSLLYVGISLSALTRLGQHRANSHWFSQICTIQVEHFPDFESARTAELNAIRSETPLYNVEGRAMTRAVDMGIGMMQELAQRELERQQC